MYYATNRFGKAADTYAKFIDTPVATEDDILKYAFCTIPEPRLREILGGGAERFAEECPPCRIQPACDVQQCRPQAL